MCIIEIMSIVSVFIKMKHNFSFNTNEKDFSSKIIL